ncbi:MAG TPA: energy transducer TonB [Gammaproteobacteria bacterium]|jgi:TonB family protein
MSSNQAPLKKSQDITDLLLYLGGIIVAGIGISWLLMTKPWDEADRPARGPAADAAVTAEIAAIRNPQPLAHPETVTDNPLRLARLAYEAGMLVEPERYSAWTLYSEVLAADPENVAATTGLNEVADALLERAATALEQGRLDAAGATLELIFARLPGHSGAERLANEISVAEQSADDSEPQRREALVEPAEPPVVQASIAAPASGRDALPVIQSAAPIAVDPVRELWTAFDAAIAAGALIQPPEQSAKHYLAQMLSFGPEHGQTIEARELLFATLLSRASIAIVGLDEVAAETWIAEAELLGVHADRIERVRNELFENLAAAESTRPIPAAQLMILEYTPPRYPTTAANRNIEGWVDVEFLVQTDGSTTDVVVSDASHESYFRDEALEAVEAWRFEPRIFHNRQIEQKAYTRIRFALE